MTNYEIKGIYNQPPKDDPVTKPAYFELVQEGRTYVVRLVDEEGYLLAELFELKPRDRDSKYVVHRYYHGDDESIPVAFSSIGRIVDTEVDGE
jgi:hypothetical protein